LSSGNGRFQYKPNPVTRRIPHGKKYNEAVDSERQVKGRLVAPATGNGALYSIENPLTEIWKRPFRPWGLPSDNTPLPHNQVICADVKAALPRIPSGSVQLVLADGPYGKALKVRWDNQWRGLKQFVKWYELCVSSFWRVLRDDGACILFGQIGKNCQWFMHLASYLCLRFPDCFVDRIIWDRMVGYNERRDSFTPAYEEVLILRKSSTAEFRKDRVREPYTEEKQRQLMRDERYSDKKARAEHLAKGKYLRNIIRVPSLKGSSKEKCRHPSQKPLELIEALIALFTDRGDLVLDPFLGSGTTAVAAQRLGRPWIGIEKSRRYCNRAEKRLAEHATTANPGRVIEHRPGKMRIYVN
jgi:DNA modification methylase